ncbi:MAG: nucleoside-diphosphate kinase [Chitinispirillaceae bacterium]|nr:nucleoside-diphosphate kinase [Chitinispirillaceae bacterium]
MPQSDQQQTLVLIKPDALKNSLTGYVLSYLSEFHTALRFAGVKIVHVTRMLAEEHYAEHRGKLFYPSLIEYIMGTIHYPQTPERRRVIAIVYQGPDAVQKIRDIAGPTNPLVARDTKPGCIRALGTLAPIRDEKGITIGERMDNLIHASANTADAEREIKLWFKPHDIPTPMHPYATAPCEEHYYFGAGKLTTTYSGGSICILAPGNVAWKSDLDALKLIAGGGKKAHSSLEAVIAKYLVNEDKEHL